MFSIVVSLAIVIVSFIAFKRYRASWSDHDLVWNIKWTVAYCYLRLLRGKSKPLFEYDTNSSDSGKKGIGTLPEAVFLENPRQLSLNINANDSISFTTVSNHDDILVVRLSRRHDRCAEVTVYLKLGANGEEYHLPILPIGLVYNTDGKRFTGAGLSLEVLEPLRCWRITFNGFLRKGANKDDGAVPVKFNLLWHPMYDYMAFPQDFDLNAMASKFARQSVKDLLRNPNKLFTQEWYHQFGVVTGTLNIDGNEQEELLLRGLKSRNHGVTDWKNDDVKVSITGVLETGLSFHAFAEDVIGIENFAYGYVLPPCNLKKHHVTQWNNELKSLQHLQEEFELPFTASNIDYNLRLSADGSQQFNMINGDHETMTKAYIVNLNGKKGRCIVEVSKTFNNECQVSKDCKSLPLLQEQEIETCDRLVVTFDNDQCKCSNIVGGKGASLALLASITENNAFVVPQGICLTKIAFSDHLIANPSLQKSILIMTNVAWSRIEGNLKEECDKLVQLIHLNELSESLKEELESALRKSFGADFERDKFAVRSSAIGEDGDELSAAGQNETFLGVTTFNNICTAVIKCWASQFSHRSVEYKRQNGQLLNGGIGVVIQRMVAAEIAGVLFTRHPVTNSPAEIMIAANYGLGESVVAATVDPDTIIVSRTASDRVYIKEKLIGSKKTKITMTDNGTVSSEVDSKEASRCSVSDDLALKLAKIAIDLEKRFGGSRDLEWAVSGDKVFLLQSRPVTSENLMTDFEIIHEFDSAPRTDNERYTTANYSEVMPGAVSPLTLSTFIRSIFIRFMMICKIKGDKPDLAVIETVTVYFGHIIMDQIAHKSLNLSKKKDALTKATEIGIYGRLLDDDDVLKLALERYEKTATKAAFAMMKMTLFGMLFGKWFLRRDRPKYHQYSISMDNCKTIEEMYETIERTFPDLEHVCDTHFKVSTGSMVWNVIILNVLSGGSGTFNMDHYTDFATLIGSCNGTESGNLLYSMLELANCIEEDGDSLEFQTMDAKMAAEWLNQRTTRTGEKYRHFIKYHGHRGYKESDMRSKPYGLQPESLTNVLQMMLKDPTLNQKSHQSSTNEIYAKLKTPLTTIQRALLRIGLSCVKMGIRQREEGKYRLMKVLDALRRAYSKLAKRLQHEGYLPEPELIHFLTHTEIALLMKTRSARILQRARKRQLLFPSMDAFVLPEMIRGIPKFVTEESIIDCNNVVQVTGYPVFQGIVQGSARVITSFEQVKTIQVGDILVTRATDIGWSPYFPLVKGVITEIGGLISHGAVVAREYGLPCIVGVQDATKFFKTGDIILLNAIKGTVTKNYVSILTPVAQLGKAFHFVRQFASAAGRRGNQAKLKKLPLG